MHRFWESIIAPAFEALEPRTVVEIGADQAKHTRKILQYCRTHGAMLHSIDTVPSFDVDTLEREFPGILMFHQARSLEVLPSILQPDAVLIDGDHNWYTVYHELLLIDAAAQRSGIFPLVFIHDVEWPYARRDLYYDPETIPEPYRQPFAKRGIDPKTDTLVEEGGLNAHLAHARSAGGERNGVRTAIEDFLARTGWTLQFSTVPGTHGLGIIAEKVFLDRHPALQIFLRSLRISAAMEARIGALEQERIHQMIGNQGLQRKSAQWWDEVKANNALQEIHIRSFHEDIGKAQRSLHESEERRGELESALHMSEGARSALITALGAEKQENAHLRQALDGVHAHIERVLQSRSWRVTKPLRKSEAVVRSLLTHARALRGEITQRFTRDNTVQSGSLFFGLNAPLPSTLSVGKGNALLLIGWCYHTTERIRSLAIRTNGELLHVPRTGIARPDIEVQERWIRDPRGHSLKSGFWCTVPLLPSDGTTATLTISATLESGRTIEEELGTVELREDAVETVIDRRKRKVCICMTTFNPNIALLKRQILSLKQQTYREWICIIQDDHSDAPHYEEIRRLVSADQRFHLFRNDVNLGFYRNFERCLQRIPRTTEYIALCDQDDEWYPQKLSKCLKTFDQGTTLVYSDMRIVDEEGHPVRESFWSDRITNNFTDFAALFFLNTVTGAASMFRRALLEKVLPFPHGTGNYYHDWWIAKNALLLGEIRYIPEPLYQYVQHRENAIGYDRTKRWSVVLFIRRTQEFFAHHRWSYFAILLRYALLAEILRLRHASTELPTDRRSLLERLAQGSFSIPWWQSVRATLGQKRTGGAQWRFPLALISVRLYNAVFALRRIPLLRAFAPPVPLLPSGRQFTAVDQEYVAALQHHTLTPAKLEESQRRAASLAKTPLISVVVPLYASDVKLLREALDSVTKQTYPHWELLLSCDGPMAPSIDALCREYASYYPDRVHLVDAPAQEGISAATNRGVAAAVGEFVTLLDHDDLLEHDALEQVASAISRSQKPLDFVYTDSDKMDTVGRRFDPEFKPDWSPELLLSYCYVGHLKVFRRSLFLDLGGFRTPFDGAQDYDFVLRLAEATDAIAHVPGILYHWRSVPGSLAAAAGAKPESIERGRLAVDEALRRRGIQGRAVLPIFAERSKIGVYAMQFDPGAYRQKVTIIIPTKDRLDLLKRCIESLRKFTSYPHWDILVANNGDPHGESIAYLKREEIAWIDVPTEGFNFSRICNEAAKHTTSPLILFLNNDTEATHSEWLLNMVGTLSLHENIGVVGAKLLFSDRRVQHCGVLLGLNGFIAGHANKLLPGNALGYLYSNAVPRNYSAVTGACMLTKRELFLRAGGFDEQHLRVAYNDVDYCLRLSTMGYRSVCTPNATLLHHEGASRDGMDHDAEVQHFKTKWASLILNDPYYNPHLSLRDGQFHIRSHPKGKRVLLVSHNLNLEGASLSLVQIARGLTRRGFSVEVLSPQDGPLRSILERESIAVSVEDYWTPGWSFHRRDAFDLLFANTLLAFPFLEKLGALKPPTIWCIRESERGKYFAAHPIPRSLFTLVDRVLFVSDSTRAAYADLDRGHFCTIENGVDLAEIDDHRREDVRQRKREELGIQKEEVVITTVGTVCARKAQKEFVEAATHLQNVPGFPKLRFLIVGSEGKSAYERDVCAMIEASGFTEQITLIEKTTGVFDYYAASDIFVCNSYVESFPRVTLEAMAFGLPIVGTNVFGIPEQVRHGLEGLLVPPGDVPALRDSLASLIYDRKRVKKFGENARRRVEERFTEDVMIEKYVSLFQDICGNSEERKDMLTKRENAEKSLPAPPPVEERVLPALPHRKNILLVSHNLNWEGASLQLYRLARGLKKQGHQLEVLSPLPGPLEQLYREEGIPTHREDYWKEGWSFPRLHQFDLVIVNTLTAFAFHQKKGPRKPPTIWWIHESDLESQNRDHEVPSIYFSFVDTVLFSAESTRKVYADFDRGHFATIHYGIDVAEIDAYCALRSRAEVRRMLGIAEEEIVVSIVGTLCARKGQREFVEAAAALARTPGLPPLTFLIVGAEGSGAYEQSVRTLVEDRQLTDRVRFIEKTQDVYRYYRATDIFVCNSSIESFPRVTLEAMAFGLPIVATNVFGIPEQISTGEEGLLIPPNDIAALTSALVRLIRNPAEAQQLGENARKRVERDFQEETMVERYDELLQTLCAA
ncbi:MAG: glycosyltransferase [Candidatus Peregrinibacteria bacterium]|nr:glycosyltransferase [Candidatus Peregrinibacteria bacterium]